MASRPSVVKRAAGVQISTMDQAGFLISRGFPPARKLGCNTVAPCSPETWSRPRSRMERTWNVPKAPSEA